MNLKKINYIERGINWIHEKTNEKQFLIFSSILVGVSAGIAAVILKLFVFGIRHYLVDGFFLKYDFKYLYLILPIIGIGLTILIVKYFFKNQLNKGNTAILFSIAKRSSFLPFHQMYSHVITSALTVGFGGSAGLESPIVSTGSAIGSNFARTYKLTYKERTLLLAAGAAGGLAGAFNAPIAGVLFALEVILVDISISAFIPLLIKKVQMLSQDPVQGALFMVVFGWGTLPMLLLVMLVGSRLQFAIRKHLVKWYPIMIGLMAILLIIRGLNLGNIGVFAMAGLIMVSTFGCNSGLILSGGRLFYAMAKDALFFKDAGELNQHDVPAKALWFQCAWACILCVSGRYSDLLTYSTFASLLFYILTIGGLFILRKKEPDAERPYKAFGYPVIPILYIVITAAICFTLLVYDTRNTGLGLFIVALGIPVYYLFLNKKK